MGLKQRSAMHSPVRMRRMSSPVTCIPCRAKRPTPIRWPRWVRTKHATPA